MRLSDQIECRVLAISASLSCIMMSIRYFSSIQPKTVSSGDHFVRHVCVQHYSLVIQ